jgi:hypothetical protein
MPAVEEIAAALADAIEAALPIWVVRCVNRMMVAWAGAVPRDVEAAAVRAGARAAAEVGPEVRALLAADIDDQPSTPLAMLRAAVSYPTLVLESAGVPPVERDAFSVHAFPEDLYDLTPASFADIDPSLHEVGLRWGAAKAFEHKRRHS